MFSKYEGDSELELTSIIELCARDSPSFLIIDDIDALSPSSSAAAAANITLPFEVVASIIPLYISLSTDCDLS